MQPLDGQKNTAAGILVAADVMVVTSQNGHLARKLFRPPLKVILVT